MKILTGMKFLSRPAARSSRRRDAGFTLLEMMVAVVILVFTVSVMVAIQIFGLRVQTLSATKLTATQSGRETLNDMRDQIRESQQVYVGMYSNSTFTQIASGQQQIGNALQVFTSTNAGSISYTIYYDNPSTNEIFKYVNTSASQTVVAKYQTNYLCFDAEDYRNWIYPTNILTNYLNNPVIRVTMSFYQWEYPVGYVVSGSVTNAVNAYDYYYLRTRITRRCKQ
jgi:prepilin-type N-terminal cleavage/methylation domain-containing protein